MLFAISKCQNSNINMKEYLTLMSKNTRDGMESMKEYPAFDALPFLEGEMVLQRESITNLPDLCSTSCYPFLVMHPYQILNILRFVLRSAITSKCRWQLGSSRWKGETPPHGSWRKLRLCLQKYKNVQNIARIVNAV